MARRYVRCLMVVLLPILASPGCSRYSKILRDSDPEVTTALATKTQEPADESPTSQILDVQSEPGKPRPFFKSSRLSGAMSDEGREVERSLGIN